MLYHWREIDVTSCVVGNRGDRPDSGMETSAQNIQGVWCHVGFVCKNGVGKLHTRGHSDQQRETGALVEKEKSHFEASIVFFLYLLKAVRPNLE